MRPAFVPHRPKGLDADDRSPTAIRHLSKVSGSARCVWASPLPFLRAPERIDYGPLKLVENLAPDAGNRRELLWDI
jgi:hypothetical protein